MARLMRLVPAVDLARAVKEKRRYPATDGELIPCFRVNPHRRSKRQPRGNPSFNSRRAPRPHYG